MHDGRILGDIQLASRTVLTFAFLASISSLLSPCPCVLFLEPSCCLYLFASPSRRPHDAHSRVIQDNDHKVGPFNDTSLFDVDSLGSSPLGSPPFIQLASKAPSGHSSTPSLSTGNRGSHGFCSVCLLRLISSYHKKAFLFLRRPGNPPTAIFRGDAAIATGAAAFHVRSAILLWRVCAFKTVHDSDSRSETSMGDSAAASARFSLCVATAIVVRTDIPSDHSFIAFYSCIIRWQTDGKERCGEEQRSPQNCCGKYQIPTAPLYVFSFSSNKSQ